MSSKKPRNIQPAITPVNPIPSGGFQPWFNSLPKGEMGNNLGRAEHKPGIVDTEDFQRWFAGSLVVDNEENPLIAYHGTASSSKMFAKRGSGPYAQLGFWFDAAPGGGVERYAGGQKPNQHPNLIPVYLSIRKPKEFASIEDLTDLANAKYGVSLKMRIQGLRKDLIKAGHDAVVIRNNQETGGATPDYWVAFKNTQIKSAIGNSDKSGLSSPSF